MKKIALFCIICILLSALPVWVGAESDFEVTVTDVLHDTVTVSCSAPVDTLVSVTILKPGATVSDITTDESAIVYMGAAFSQNGKFVHNINMNTGQAPNKVEGAFTILVSIDGTLVYSDSNFIFYSNETKLGYVNLLKTGTKAALLATDDNSQVALVNIFEIYSLSFHELYIEADLADIADVIVNQAARASLDSPAQVNSFLENVLVLNAFFNASDLLKDGNNFKYTGIWALEGDAVSNLYTDNFINDLSDAGKEKVTGAMFGANYSGAQFTKPFEVFENAMLYNLIMNNILYGSGHIDDYVLSEFEAEYKAAGFDTDALKKITGNKRSKKLDKILDCGATSLEALKDKFNQIVTEEESSSGGASGGSGGGGGGGAAVPPSKGDEPSYVPDESNPPQPPASDIACPFTDLSGAQWASEAAVYLYEKGIINGRSETEFAPSETVTRAEIVKMIVKALSVPEGENEAAFTDVSENDWFAPYIKKAASCGIIKGSGGAFVPNSAITREDAAVIIFRALGLENGKDLTFNDKENISDYAREAIAAMAEKGYISGMGDGSFAPKNTLTRAQAAQLIYNILKGGAA